MCEAAAYVFEDGEEKLLLEAVDLVEPKNGEFRIVSLYGEEKIVRGRIKSVNLLNHKIVFET